MVGTAQARLCPPYASSFSFTNSQRPPDRFRAAGVGEGLLIISTVAARRRALFVLALTVTIAGTRLVTQSWAAGAFAIGNCGAYGQAYDYSGLDAARVAALKQCKGECTAVTMKRACAALAIDMTNPC